ncbi:MAG: hypothetical protein DRP85_09720 [Candidatus Makaraimicrobium thalassicum]|nr:MAG: hypothetical protein DRP85_09720 [Candidatus Omnitrophota bacterium]
MRVTVAENWWQVRGAERYLIESIAYFNEARVYSRDGDETSSHEAIFKGLDVLRTGMDINPLLLEPDHLLRSVELLLGSPGNRLAVYGTLRPGESNHRVIAGIKGEWISGFVRGRMEEYYGFPFFVPDARSGTVPVEVLTSSELCNSWAAIDRFEGRWYDRSLIPILDSNGEVLAIANIYCKSRSPKIRLCESMDKLASTPDQDTSGFR